jgi:CBS domain containing-hemolysin-like protein
MTVAGHVLKPGELVNHNDLIFRVERVERRRVMRVSMELQEKTTEESEPDPAASGAEAAR